jgi:hypothetical protein
MIEYPVCTSKQAIQTQRYRRGGLGSLRTTLTLKECRMQYKSLRGGAEREKFYWRERERSFIDNQEVTEGEREREREREREKEKEREVLLMI